MSLFRPLLCLVCILGVLLSGCAPSENTTRSSSSASSEAASSGPAARLASTHEDVRTIQVYAGTPRDLPIATLGSGETVTLAFDLMGRDARPLSISFHHADRTWERDLSTSQFMESFATDLLTNYRRSQGTQQPYVHYTYTFPNNDIRFRISGNYILRVTEQGNPDAVLFERPFFIDESAGTLNVSGESVVVTGQRQPSLRPVARFTPPDALGGNSFDYNVCFVRNGEWTRTRCSERPGLMERPALLFELERSNAYAPRALAYGVDLSNLRAGGDIERVDRSTSPYQVLLEPDAAQFPDLGLLFNGQVLGPDVGAFGRSNPATTAEYVRTTFAFVPPNEQRLPRPPALRGTFGDPPPSPGVSMTWVPSRQRYEGDVLLKQGRYQYAYETDAATRALTQRQSASMTDDIYTTFVYYRDLSRNTDRLLSVGTLRP